MLDDAEFIEGLYELGLEEVLGRFQATESSLAPEDRAWAEVARLRLDADRLLSQAADAWQAGDPELARRLKDTSRLRMEEALDRLDALGRSRALDGHPRRAVWLIELARLTLAEALPRYYEDAGSFLAFGVPSARQRQAVSHHAPRALAAALDAREAIDRLFERLEQDPAMRDALDAAGRLHKLEVYRDRILPYVLCEAALLTALLPDDDPYYQQQAGATPDQQRERLRRSAMQRAAALAKSEPSIAGPAAVLAARAAVRLGRAHDALELHLPRARSPDSVGLAALHADLVQARALADVQQRVAAEDALVDLRLHPAVNADPTWFRLLLVTDALHATALRSALELPEGPRRRDALASAYTEPYRELYDDGRVGASADALRAYVLSRWDAQVEAGADPTAMPGNVRVTIAERALSAGRSYAQAHDAERAAAAYGRALRATDGLQTLGLSDDLLERGRYARALALLMRVDLSASVNEDFDAKAMLEACAALVDFAEQSPEAPQAAGALSAAVGRLAQLASRPEASAEARSAYVQAGGRLLERYPDSPAAHDHRVYFAYAVAQRSGDVERAIRLYRAQPAGHRDFYEARRLLVVVLEQAYRRAQQPGGDLVGLPQARADLEQAARDVRMLAEAAEREGLDPSWLTKARQARATAELALAQIADDRGDLDRVLLLLDGFEDRFQNVPGSTALAESAVRKRILALARAEPIDSDALRDEARRLIDRFRERSAPVVAAVLDQIEMEIDRLRKQAQADPGAAGSLERRAAGLGLTAVDLSRMLVDWAQQNDPERIGVYRLSEARALLAAGDPDAAEAASADLLGERPTVPAILLRAQVLQRLAERDNDADRRRAALGLYDQITRFYAARPDAATAEAHWAAWAGRCELLLDAGRGDQVARLSRRFTAKYGEDFGVAPYGERIRRAAARAVLDR